MGTKIAVLAAAAAVLAVGGFFLLRPEKPRQPEAPVAPRPAIQPAPVPSGPPGAIEGEVLFAGAPPEAGRLHREADPYCAHTPMNDPSVLVENGKLANVWVHVTGAPDAPPPASAVEVDQKNCMYEPRVTTAITGQTLLARSADPVLHNVHAYLGPSTIFNRGLPNDKAAPVSYVTKEPGLIAWKCDVHPWMRGWVGVSNNGLQAVTGANGAFSIPNVPAGHYTLEAWHERYGVESQQLTVEPGKPVRVSFSYPAN